MPFYLYAFIYTPTHIKACGFTMRFLQFAHSRGADSLKVEVH